MTATRPEAKSEYSRGPTPVERPGSARAAAAIAGLAGAAALLGTELSPLLRVRTIAIHPRLVRTVQAGPHHGWALVPIAAVAAVLCVLAWRSARPPVARAAALSVVAFGLATLGVALLGDLPDVHSTGLVGSTERGLSSARTQAALGLYLETLGAVLLVVAGVGTAFLTGRRGGGGFGGLTISWSKPATNRDHPRAP